MQLGVSIKELITNLLFTFSQLVQISNFSKFKGIMEESTSSEPSPQFLQKKLYFLIEKLKEYHSQLPLQVEFNNFHIKIFNFASNFIVDSDEDSLRTLNGPSQLSTQRHYI